MLRITIEKNTVDLPPNTEISVSLTSPIFNDKGSYSLPFKIARSKRNMHVLKHPDRITAASIGNVNFNTTIEVDNVKLAGTSEITELTTDEVEMALKINEGSFWEWAKMTKMTELIFPEDPYPTLNVTQKTEAWKNRIIASPDKPYPIEYFTMFPVLIGRNTSNARADWDRILNSINIQTGNFKAEIVTTPFVGIKDFAPFLYLNAAIEFICNSYGIRLVYNFLQTIDELNRLCIIHNSTMPVRDGKLHWNELLPADSVNDFINWIEGKFPVHFTVDMNKREASVISIEDICLKFEPIKVNGAIDVITEEARHLSMTCEHYSSDYCKPSDYSEEQLKALPFSIHTNFGMTVDGDIYYAANTPDYVNYPNKIIYVRPNNCYFFLRWISVADETCKWHYTAKLIGNGDRNIEGEGENTIKIETSFCLPAMSTGIVVQDIIHNGGKRGADLQYFVIPEYIVALKDFIPGFFELNGYDDSVNFTPALCTYRGSNQYYSVLSPWVNGDEQHTTDNRVPWGSPYLYDKYSVRIGSQSGYWINMFSDKISLQLVGEDGIYNNFWKFYANIFINSAKPVTVTKGLQFFKNPKFDRLYRIGDTNILLNEVKQTLTETGIRVDEVTGYTVKHYE